MHIDTLQIEPVQIDPLSADADRHAL